MPQRSNIWTMQADKLSVGSSLLNNYCNEWMFWQMLFQFSGNSILILRKYLPNVWNSLHTFWETLMNMHWNLNFNQNCRFAEFSYKIFVITVKGLKPDTQPPLALETRMLPQCQQNTCRDRIFKLSPIHASVIYYIPWIQKKFCSI